MSNIGLAIIVKDDTEVESLRKCLTSAREHVQGIFITGTKEPQKKIKELCKEFKAEYSFFPWNDSFADARNYAFSQVPVSYEWILWLDADDVLHGGQNFPKLLEEASRLNMDAVFAKYIYYADFDDKKACSLCGQHGQIKSSMIEHLRERLLRNNGKFKWIGSIHETCIAQVQVNQTDNYDFEVIHLTTYEKMETAIYRNISLLEEQVLREDGKDPRAVYYLAKALYDLNDEMLYDYTIGLIQGYLKDSGWPEERAQAWEYLAELHRRCNRHDMAIIALMEAVHEWPQFPQIYVDLAMTYLIKGDFQKAEHWINIAAGLDIPKTTLVISPRDMAMRVLEVRFLCYWNTGRIDQAFDAVSALLKLVPDPVNQSRFDMVLEAKRDNLLAHCIAKLATHLRQTGDTKKLDILLKAIPKEIEKIPTMVDLRMKSSEPRVWGDKEVAIYCGSGFEEWGPESLMKGLGGSESAVIYLSREIQKLGYQVTVYGDPGDEVEDQGVKYLPYYAFNPQDKFNVFVSWRIPQLVDMNLNAKLKLVWLHDIANPADFTEERLRKIDKIICLSDWHRKNLSNVPDDKFAIIGNGIPIENISSVRKPTKLIYSSSYDRGLEHLLKMWSDIRKDVPEAELTICYGWDMFDKVVGNNVTMLEWKKVMEELMNQPGINHKGRISHQDLLQEFASSGIWAYPTHFGETSCQTAMMAQVYGAVPVVIDYAALKETVKYGLKIDGDIYDQETKSVYKDALIALLKDPEKQEEIRKNMIKDKNFGWDIRAKDWVKLFNLEDQVKQLISENEELKEFLPDGI